MKEPIDTANDMMFSVDIPHIVPPFGASLNHLAAMYRKLMLLAQRNTSVLAVIPS